MDEADKDMGVNDLVKLNYEQAAEIERLKEVDRLREAAFDCYVEEQKKDKAEIERLRAALYSIIGLYHHDHGPESQAEKIARAALNEQKMQEQIGCMSTRDDYPR